MNAKMILDGLSAQCYYKDCTSCDTNGCECDCHELKTEERD